MQSLIYLAFAALGFVIPYGISLAIGNEVVQNVVLFIYIIPVSYTHLTLPTKA